MFNLILLSLLPAWLVILVVLWRRRHTGMRLALFTAHLATTVERQRPLGEALRNLARDAKDRPMREALFSVAEDVESGMKLSDALEKHPRLFPDVYVRMIEAGEESNNLFDVLHQLSGYYRQTEDFREKVSAVILYPLILVIAVLCVQTFIFVFVLPQWEHMFEEMDFELPALTSFLFFLADHYWLTLFWAWPFVFIIVIYVLDLTVMRNHTIRFMIDRLKLSLPMIGHINKSAILDRFCRTWGVLLQGNVPMLRALELVGKVSGNKLVDIAIAHIRMQVSEGAPVAEALYGDRFFPRTLVWMASVGEERGDLAQTLLNCSEIHRRRVERLTEALKFFLSPIFAIVIIMPFLGVVIVALFLPFVRIMAELGG